MIVPRDTIEESWFRSVRDIASSIGIDFRIQTKLVCLCLYHIFGLLPMLHSQVEVGQGAGVIPPDYNLKVDELYFTLAPTASVGWDSNFDRSSDGGGGSMVSSAGFLLDAVWLLSPYLKFSSSVDIRYYTFSGRDGKDGWRIQGGSEGAAAMWGFDLLFDEQSRLRLSVSAQSALIGVTIEQSNGSANNRTVDQFGYSINADYSTRLTPYTSMSLGYTYAESLALEDEFTNADRTRHEFDAALSSSINDKLSASAYFEPAFLLSDSEVQSDLVELSAGVRFRLNLGGGVASLGIGASYVDFLNQASTDSYKGGLEPQVEARLDLGDTSGWRHSFVASYRNRAREFLQEDEAGDLASTSRENLGQLGYNVSVPLSGSASLSARTGLTYITSNFGNSSRYYFGSGAGYQLSSRLSARLEYEFENQYEASRDSLEFVRHQIVLAFIYRF